MKRDLYIVGPAGRGAPNAWHITRNGDIIAYEDTQAAATAAAAAAAIARKRWREDGQLAELQIRRRDGTIRDSRTYGKDPRRTRG